MAHCEEFLGLPLPILMRMVAGTGFEPVRPPYDGGILPLDHPALIYRPQPQSIFPDAVC